MNNFIDIWEIDLKTSCLESYYHDLVEILSAEEMTRYKKFINHENARNFLISHFNVRNILSHYCPSIKPQDWIYDYEKYGKPTLSTKYKTKLNLRFNLTHTRTKAFFIVTNSCECGIDSEEIRELKLTESLLDHIFSEQEKKQFLNTPQERKFHDFFCYWTLKESYIKSIGTGFSTNIKNIEFYDVADFVFDNKAYNFIKDNHQYWIYNLSNYILSFTVKDLRLFTKINFYSPLNFNGELHPNFRTSFVKNP